MSVLLYIVQFFLYLIVFKFVSPSMLNSAGRQRVLLTGGNKMIGLINHKD